MARRFYLLCVPNGKEEWLVDFLSIVWKRRVPRNGKEEWLVDFYLLCVPNGKEECVS